MFTPEKNSLLKNIHPWKIFTPEKYSPHPGWWLDGTLARFGSAAGGGDCDKLFSCTDPSSYCQQAIQWGSNTCAAIKYWDIQSEVSKIMHWNIVCLLEFQRDKSIKTSGRLLLSGQHVLNYFFDLLSVWNLVKRASKRKRPPIYQAGCCRRIEDQGKILSLITVCSSYLNLRLVQLWWRGFRD